MIARRVASAAARRLRPILAPGARPVILMYHRVADERFDPWGLAVRPFTFERQMQWIADNRTPLPLAELVRRHLDGSLPRNAVAITFDDGYACIADNAVPLLERLNLPATLFVAANYLGRVYWWDELAALVLATGKESLKLDGSPERIPEPQTGDREFPAGSKPRTARQKLFVHLWRRLRTRSASEIDRALETLRDGAETSISSMPRALDAVELQGLQSDRVAIGAHTLSHRSLPTLSSSDKRNEIFGSFERCAELTGRRPSSFAYPFGDCDAESMRLASEAGFECACTTAGTPVTGRSDCFALPRMQIGEWRQDRFAAKLGGR